MSNQADEYHQEFTPAEKSQVTFIIANAVNTARAAVKDHIATDDSGSLFPFAPGDHRRLSENAPAEACAAASFLRVYAHSAKLRGECVSETDWLNIFLAGWSAREVLAADLFKKPSHAVLQDLKEQSGWRVEGGHNSCILKTEEQKKLALKIIAKKLQGNVSKTAAYTRTSFDLFKFHGIDISAKALGRFHKKSTESQDIA